MGISSGVLPIAQTEEPLNVVTTSLGAEAKNVREARRFVERALDDWDLSQLADLATLLTSELVTNAILHAHSAVELSLTLATDRIRIEVRDDGDGEPARRELAVEATSGRGLALVDLLATDWGVIGHGLGKSVWFELLR